LVAQLSTVLDKILAFLIAEGRIAIRHLRKLMSDPSPNLSPKRREALIPPSFEGKGGRGVRSAREFKVSKSFSEMSIAKGCIAIAKGGIAIAERCIGIAEGRISIAEGRISIAEGRIGIAEGRIGIAERCIGITKFNLLQI
jgi:hypothetical protein